MVTDQKKNIYIKFENQNIRRENWRYSMGAEINVG